VVSGVCDPRGPAAAAARRLCIASHDGWDQLLDLPAGDHYLWFSTTDGSPTDIRLALEEVAIVPEGEACGDPYDTASASYVAPGSAGEPHVWDLPAGPHNSVDITATNAPFQAISCREEPYGDVVVAIPKAANDTVLDIRVQGSGFGVTAEVITGGCRPADPGAMRSGCINFAGSTTPRRMTATGPAGLAHLWLAHTSSTTDAFPGAHVEVREIPAPTAPGSSCATAIPITPGTSVAITPDHAERYFAPSCVPVDSNVTWYAFDTSERLTRVTTTGAGAIGLVRATTGAEVSCLLDATTTPVSLFAPAGTRICVAVESGSAVSALSIESILYTGVGADPAVSLNIDPPSLEGTPYSSILGDTWLALTPTKIWQNIGTAGIYSAPRSGSAQATVRFDVDGAVLGDESIAVGEQLFSMELSSGASRFYRFTDASGTWAPSVWDPGADYARSTRTVTSDGSSFFTVDELASTTTPRLSQIYRIPGGAPGTPVVVGNVDTVYDIDSLVADSTWFYIAAAESSTVRGLYRVRRADVEAGTATPTRFASFGTQLTLRLDDLASPRYLYVRDNGDIHVIEDPGGTARNLGRIFDGDDGDRAMDYDRATDTMVFFSTHQEPNGEWYRFGP
jgi:hypothetical protein